ncbi:MAG: FAD-dependent oxidoreductase [Chitinophagales bacterium]
MLDYLIVGQGIAGSLVAWFLKKENKTFAVIDSGTQGASSTVAAGLINPITGRKYNTTWLAETLLPFAEATYREIGEALGESIYAPIPLYHLFDSVKAQNDWSVKCGTAAYNQFLAQQEITYLDKEKVNNAYGSFEVSGAARIQALKLNQLVRQWLLKTANLIEERFDYSALQLNGQHISYKGIEARMLIFCEGAGGYQNPFFNFIPYQLAKGEVLIVRIKDFYNDRIIKGEVGIVPWDGEDLFYVGATHHWEFTNALPSERGRKELEDGLQLTIKAPYEVTEHRAAIRPCVTGRRPFIGKHPLHPQLATLNGLGTKGFSLSPYFAKQLISHLEHNSPLMPEINIARAFKV